MGRRVRRASPETVSTTSSYQAELQAKGFTADEAQLRGLAALQRCEDEWLAYKARRSNAVTKLLVKPPLPKGVYLYGGVGRGKSFLMDCFFQALPLQRKVRLHFHEFMRELHLRGVSCSVHWRPLHLHPYYEQTFGWRPEDLPVATRTWDTLVSLPLFSAMRQDEIDTVVNSVKELCAQTSRAFSAGRR